MTKHVAIYLRVSSKDQSHASQLPELEQYAKAQTEPVKFYRDKFTGKTMHRKDWEKLESAYRAGKVSKIVCWRLDRLGRTASGLTKLFDELREHKVNLVSIRDGLDLSTPAGRLMANVLASVAQYETEVRQERQAAGIAAAKANGITWGGSEKGVAKKVTTEKAAAIHKLFADKTPVSRIAKAVGLSRPTIYTVLNGAATAK